MSRDERLATDPVARAAKYGMFRTCDRIDSAKAAHDDVLLADARTSMCDYRLALSLALGNRCDRNGFTLSLRRLVPALDTDLETRARCQDDGHPAGVFNPWMGVTFCHCGRVHYLGEVERVRWPDDEARLVEHVGGAA